MQKEISARDSTGLSCVRVEMRGYSRLRFPILPRCMGMGERNSVFDRVVPTKSNGGLQFGEVLPKADDGGKGKGSGTVDGSKVGGGSEP
ncbi:hypothetical protein L6452_09226 [Arctium lappa]|uniref:Uncharacterized protein n=1 Tax=Arctium lappa TaxID=4217 RepID=A0ACB9DKL2_ARCLA|nr:hypothetical protein L6452_09226 [Arctium lappa]